MHCLLRASKVLYKDCLVCLSCQDAGRYTPKLHSLTRHIAPRMLISDPYPNPEPLPYFPIASPNAYHSDLYLISYQICRPIQSPPSPASTSSLIAGRFDIAIYTAHPRRHTRSLTPSQPTLPNHPLHQPDSTEHLHGWKFFAPPHLAKCRSHTTRRTAQHKDRRTWGHRRVVFSLSIALRDLLVGGGP